jgi:hypothetical protein
MIFLSIAWYAALLFLVGIKGGCEIIRMARALSDRPGDDAAQPVTQDSEP